MWFITSLTYNLLPNISYNILYVAGHPDNYLPSDVELAHWKKFSWEHILFCSFKLLWIIPSFTFKLPSNIPYNILYAAGYRDNYLLLMLSLPTEERVNDECLHATELFVILQCTCPDIIFHFCVAHSLWQDTSIRLMCKVLFCQKKFFFRENKQGTQFVVIRVSINVLPLLCP